MTQLQQTEFDILVEFDRVCTQLNLPYFLVCGSALGAVKYGGFIPWDDDIDVGMLREDYEVFLEKAPGLLPKHLFLQNRHSEPAYPQIFSKLRNSNTTFIEKTAGHLPINHGVFIDIFPLDGYPRKKWQQRMLELRKRLYGNMILSVFDIPISGLSRLTHPVYRLLGIPGRIGKVTERFEKMIRRYSAADSDIICNHGNWQAALEYAPKWQYGAGKSAVFEGLQVRIPEQAHAYLTQKYGDYTKDLPPEQQVGHHSCRVCDCTRAYCEYI